MTETLDQKKARLRALREAAEAAKPAPAPRPTPAQIQHAGLTRAANRFLTAAHAYDPEFARVCFSMLQPIIKR